MSLDTPKSVSVTEQGEPDGWTPTAGYVHEMDPHGETRLVISVPVTYLLSIHKQLAHLLTPPLGVLYRQVVDRRNPKPQGSPPRDWVALDQPQATVVEMLESYSDLFHHDARCELWLRGAKGEQLILDADGLLYAYPDEPAVLDLLHENGFIPDVKQTIVDRDYARHWFHASNDALEDRLVKELRMVEIPPRG